MRRYLVLIAALFIWGCHHHEEVNIPVKELPTQKLPLLNEQADLKTVKTVGVGEMCGGIAGFMCKSGLMCKISAQHPDAGGTCIETVIQKELVCPPTKDPVCGLKDGVKNGYLNECQAIRHGAEIVNKGFCKLDESVKGNCEADFMAIGNCEMAFSGFVFNAERNACTKKFASGCEAEIPFSSLEDCQKNCVK